MFKTISKSEVNRQRLDSMCRVFERVDRVLAQQKVTCKVADDGPAAAWSTSEAIFFNASKIDSVTTVDDLIMLNGLNYHELSHILRTPRKHDSHRRAIEAKGLFWAFNILEDQRIETFLVNEYPATAPYLTSIVMRFVAGEEKNWMRTFPYSHGRRYLPQAVRDQFEARYHTPANVQRIGELIDEFRFNEWKTQADKDAAADIVVEFAALVSQTDQQADPFDHSSHNPDPQGYATKGQSGQESQKSEDGESNDEESDDDDSEDGGGGDSGEGQQGNGDAEGDSDDDGEDDDGISDGGGEAGAVQDDSTEPDQSMKGTEGSGGKKSSGQVSAQDLRDMIDQAIDDVESLPEVKQEIGDIQKAIRDISTSSKNYRSELEKLKGSVDRSVTPEMVLAAKRVGREVDRLARDLDPGFISHKPSGRINMKRAMHGDIDYDTVFDSWEAGTNDATDIEMVILIDQSGSMSLPAVNATLQAMWVVKRGVEMASSQTNVTVLGYDDESRLLIPGGSRESTSKYRVFPHPGGMTDPIEALNEARRIFATTRKSRGVLIVMTDGQWNGDVDLCDQIVKHMGEVGILTGLAFLGNKATNADTLEGRHYCDVGVTYTNPYDLIEFVKNVVKSAMKKGK